MKPLFRFLLVVLLTLPDFAFSQASGTMKAHIINVGQGNAALLEFPCGVVLIDAGGESNTEFNSRQVLSDYLKEFFDKRPSLNKTINLFLITHPHKDHVLGVRDVLDNYTVKNVVTNGQEYGSGSSQQKLLHKYVDDSEATTDAADDIGYFESVLSKINATGKTNTIIDPLNCSDIDPSIKVLWGRVPSHPQSWGTEAFHNNNNHSVVTRVDFGESSMLFTGDLEDVAIADMVKKYKNTTMLDVDVYIVGHHASRNGSTVELVKAMSPEIAIISCGDPERELPWTAWKYGHPNKGIVKILSDNCSKTRISKEVLVGDGATNFQSTTISKAIYATGWDGHIVLEATREGRWINLAEEVSNVVNINTATLQQLKDLPYLGDVRAQAIYNYRQANGNFSSIDDLDKVPGIGPGTIVRLRDRIKV